MPECFVTLDKYKADLARFAARDALLIESLEDRLKKISNECTSQALSEMALLRELIAMLRQPLDFWFTRHEWSNPISASRERFSSVSDVIQTHFEFEGER